MKKILSIDMSVPAGLSGIQQDIKTITKMGFDAITAVTAISGKGPVGNVTIMSVPSEILMAQIKPYISEAAAVKIGFIPDVKSVEIILSALEDVNIPVVYDMGANNSIDSDFVSLINNYFLPKCSVITPSAKQKQQYGDILKKYPVFVKDRGNDSMIACEMAVKLASGMSLTDIVCNESNSVSSSTSTGTKSHEWMDNAIAVDAACSGNPGKMEYRGVNLMNGQEIFHFGPVFGTNNIGEFLAIVHGLALLKQKGLDDMPIYSDSVNAQLWVKKKHCKTTLERNNKTEELYKMIERAENWLKKNTWRNPIIKWETKKWGEIPADFGRK